MRDSHVNEASEDLQQAAPGEVVTVDQPGGAVAMRDGVPINPLSVHEAVAASFDVVSTGLPWLGPLTHAAVVCAPDSARRASLLSPWSEAGDSDPAKHAEYEAYLRQEIGSQFPWLWPLLDACGALVAVSPGVFSFCNGVHLGISFDAPQLHQFTYLNPFAVDGGEVAH